MEPSPSQPVADAPSPHKEEITDLSHFNRPRPSHLLPLVGVIIVMLILVGVASLVKRGTVTLPGLPTPTSGVIGNTEGEIWKQGQVAQFKSEADFREYVKRGQELASSGSFGNLATRDVALEASPQLRAPMADQFGPLQPTTTGGSDVDRVSGTNVQVVGIDEPDMVKSDGKNLYFSKQFSNYYWRTSSGGGSSGVALPMVIEDEPLTEMERRVELISPDVVLPPTPTDQETLVLTAFPPETLNKIGGIDKIGDLLLVDKTLVILADQHVYGFDVSNPASPIQKWDMQYGENSYLVTARLKDNTLYLVTSSYLDYNAPCPIRPLASNNSLTIPCTEIYHPIQPISVNNTYAALKINPHTGEVGDKVAFVGSTGSQSVVYMSPESLYVSYGYMIDTGNLMMDFILSEGRALLPEEIVNKIEKLRGYEISSQAKFTELNYILESYQGSVSEDERLKLQNELENRGSQYFKRRQRDIERTGIVKINLDNLAIDSTGDVPGSPLNQFSLDEYQGNLRIATTINRNWMFGGEIESANDVYVLDDQLRLSGSIQGLGLTERIYSARFIGDRGYVVTFRQIDPFYILDLSDPKRPKMTGELKIPGYSSYLHPITDNLILGIGKEGSDVKISMFDVSSATNPQEVGKYILNEYDSDILQTHHAFLHDPKHSVFFIPGANGGYVFKYENNGATITLQKAIATIRPRRALFINDFLYVVGDDGLVVLNESDWEEVNRMSWE